MSLSQLASSLNYLQGFNNEGDQRALENNEFPGIIAFNGTSFFHADGSDMLPIELPKLQVRSDPIKGLVGLGLDGLVVKFCPDTNALRIPVFYNGQLAFQTFNESGVIGVPNGSGITVRQPGDNIPASMYSGIGIVYINAEGNISSIAFGSEGDVVKMHGGIPKFLPVASNIVTAGAASVGMSGVVSNRSGNHAISLSAPSFTLTDGVTEQKVENVSGTLDIGTVGVGGVDLAPSPSVSSWYYVYIISDGSSVALVASLDGTSPSGTNLGSYTFKAIAGIIRTNSSGNIVEYLQRGRDFWTEIQPWGSNLAINRTWQPITSGTALNTLVPPNVKTVSGLMGGQEGSGDVPARRMAIASTNTGLAAQFFAEPYTSMHLTDASGHGNELFEGNVFPFLKLPISNPASPVLYWKTPSSAASTFTDRRIAITGYSI